jgi:hypothetical protein
MRDLIKGKKGSARESPYRWSHAAPAQRGRAVRQRRNRKPIPVTVRHSRFMLSAVVICTGAGAVFAAIVPVNAAVAEPKSNVTWARSADRSSIASTCTSKCPPYRTKKCDPKTAANLPRRCGSASWKLARFSSAAGFTTHICRRTYYAKFASWMTPANGRSRWQCGGWDSRLAPMIAS